MARASCLESLVGGVLKLIVIILLLFAGLLYLGINAPDHKQLQSERTNFDPAPEPFVLDPELQADRLEFIEKFMEAGLIGKIDGGKFPTVWTKPLFYALTFEDKEKILIIIYSYYFPDGGDRRDFVMLRDGMSGKEAGIYGLAYDGLKMK